MKNKHGDTETWRGKNMIQDAGYKILLLSDILYLVSVFLRASVFFLNFCNANAWKD